MDIFALFITILFLAEYALFESSVGTLALVVISFGVLASICCWAKLRHRPSPIGRNVLN